MGGRTVRVILAAVFVAGAAFQAWWGTGVLSNIWGYRDSTVQTYVTVSAVLYAVGLEFLVAAIAVVARIERGWLILALLLACAAVVPYWLWVDNLRVSYVNNLAFGLLAVVALLVHALTRSAARSG
jgi:hypothetical protein